jgi:PTS system glucitol/sorbitol-specific IIC component
VVIFIRGVLTERITAVLIKRMGKTDEFAEYDRKFADAGLIQE